MVAGICLGILFLFAVFDSIRGRIPNLHVVLSLLLALVLQAGVSGGSGAAGFLAGSALGLLVFLPFYMVGGVAAGDVKLMAVVGGFLGWQAVLWAAACTLIAGTLLGLLYLLLRGGLGRLLHRYWASFALRAYVPAGENDVSRDRIPYAIAIFAGTLASLLLEAPPLFPS